MPRCITYTFRYTENIMSVIFFVQKHLMCMSSCRTTYYFSNCVSIEHFQSWELAMPHCYKSLWRCNSVVLIIVIGYVVLSQFPKVYLTALSMLVVEAQVKEKDTKHHPNSQGEAYPPRYLLVQ